MPESDFKEILNRMLSKVSDEIDKREGSIIYNTLSPTAYSLAEQIYMLAYMENLMFGDTAEGEWLDRVVNDFGLSREPATQAVREIVCTDKNGEPTSVEVDTRFAVNNLTFKVLSIIQAGKHECICEQFGTMGNSFSGAILPIDNINDLGVAVLSPQPIIPARDVETDKDLRKRFYIFVRQTPFGGNIADYTEKALSINGVGACAVFNATEMGAGNVGVVIGDEHGNKATDLLVEQVQDLFGDNGNGLAPIGHNVMVNTCTDFKIDILAELHLKSGVSLSVVKPVVLTVIQDYIENINFSDTTVFYAKLIALILNAHEAIVDVGTVTMNTLSSNIYLIKTFSNFQVPIIGEIQVSEVQQ